VIRLFHRNSASKGFTLIELLVVVSIIAMLSTIVLASLNSARAKARDARRLADMRQVQNALELYYNDNGHYPNTSNEWQGETCWDPSDIYDTSGPSGYIPDLAPTHIAVLPTDPKSNLSNCYIYKSNGADYMFLVYGSVEGVIPTSLKRPRLPAELNYTIYSRSDIPTDGCATHSNDSNYPACW